MIIRKFRLNCILRVITLSLCIVAAAYAAISLHQYLFASLIGLAVCIQVFTLIKYVEKTNYYLIHFFDAVKYEDFSQSFSGLGLGRSFNELKSAFKEILEKFQNARIEKEEHLRRLQIVLNHIGAGLISYRDDGSIDLINNAARRLLQSPRLKNISQLSAISGSLVENLKTLRPGESCQLKIFSQDDILNLHIYATEFILNQEHYKLVSIQDIQSELEEKEMDAWHNLIRVLTHEIMNSVTPISSLASTVNSMLMQEAKGSGEIHSKTDIQAAVQTIEKRSHGLLQFVQSYRKLTRLPEPNFQLIPLQALFERIRQLMAPDAEKVKVNFNILIEPESLELTADSALIEQVLINLILNALDAVKNVKKPEISLKGELNPRGRVLVKVINNGVPIDPEVQDSIFIPFFTTKEKGSGIGLSLSRQIMRAHRGSITVRSAPGSVTAFTLKF